MILKKLGLCLLLFFHLLGPAYAGLELTNEENLLLSGPGPARGLFQGLELELFSAEIPGDNRALITQRLLDRFLQEVLSTGPGQSLLTTLSRGNVPALVISTGVSAEGAYKILNKKMPSHVSFQWLKNGRRIIGYRFCENRNCEEQLISRSPRRWVIAMVEKNNQKYDSWTNNDGSSVILLERREKNKSSEFIKILAHELAMGFDTLAVATQAWSVMLPDEMPKQALLQALNNPSLNLGLKTLRAFRFEQEVFNDLKPKHPTIQASILYQKFSDWDNDQCIEALEYLIGELRRLGLHHVAEDDGEIDDYLDLLEETSVDLNPHYLDHQEFLKHFPFWKNEDEISACLYLGQYNFWGQVMGSGSGPRPRIGTTD